MRARNALADLARHLCASRPKQRVASGRNAARATMCVRTSRPAGPSMRFGRVLPRAPIAPEELVEVALVQREEQRVLAVEVQVHRALREPRLVGDLRDVRDAVRRAGEQPLGCVEDGVDALLLVFGRDGALADHHVELT